MAFALPAEMKVTGNAKLVLGQRIYYNSCVYCHGIEGRGQGYLLCAKSNLVGKNIPEEEIITNIQRPTFPMPPLRLTTEEQQSVAEYVHSRITSGKVSVEQSSARQ